jgi:hypothetical protein
MISPLTSRSVAAAMPNISEKVLSAQNASVLAYFKQKNLPMSEPPMIPATGVNIVI